MIFVDSLDCHGYQTLLGDTKATGRCELLMRVIQLNFIYHIVFVLKDSVEQVLV